MSPTRHVYPYGIIGNCAYLAHIDTHANASWLCWPRFDSSFIFGGMLDSKKGGEFRVSPAEEAFSSHQSYLENTNILRTVFESSSGKFSVEDFAPRFKQYERYFKPLLFFRKVTPLSGNPKVRVRCRPMGDYGNLTPEVQCGSNHLRYSGLGEQVRLTTNIALTYVANETEFVLNEPKYLCLSWGTPLEAPLESTAEEFLRRTELYWKEWVLHSYTEPFHQEAVIRSALALKLHQYDDTGAIIAAGTTSLPESPGSGRNWDYRYCWLRDAYYTLSAFGNIGKFEELAKFAQFIQNMPTKKDGRYAPVYSISGNMEILENQTELEGYQGHAPVRVGNQAWEHIQNDLYGQVLLSILPLYCDSRLSNVLTSPSVQIVEQLLSLVEKTMDEPDAGLWEYRNRAHKHCYTFLFHWAGAQAAEKIASQFKNPKLKTLATTLKNQAAKNIEDCYDPARAVYQQSANNSGHLDASLLNLITMNYLDPASEKAAHHLAALKKDLRTEEGLFYRYRHADDFGKPGTAFLVCAFWYVEALACLGNIEEAIHEFERLLPYANHLGLMSEDVDPKDGSQWGNFPQTYSHVGLVNAAFRISRKLDRPHFL